MRYNVGKVSIPNVFEAGPIGQPHDILVSLCEWTQMFHNHQNHVFFSTSIFFQQSHVLDFAG